MKLFNRKNHKYQDIKMHVGEVEGTYDYYQNFIRKYPTYDKIVSDYLR